MNKKALWIVIYITVIVWSAYEPYDRFTWWLEAIPALLALPILAFTYPHFRLTSLAYGLILLHCIVLLIGAKYTYAEVPLFDWIAQLMGNDRNNYDKLGHLAQGFVPVILAREVLLRHRVLQRGYWCHFLSLCFVLAFSAFYELIEWWVGAASGEGAEAFLGTQGYAWDTQSDMFMALIGGIVGLCLLTNTHNKQLSHC